MVHRIRKMEEQIKGHRLRMYRWYHKENSNRISKNRMHREYLVVRDRWLCRIGLSAEQRQD